MLKIKNDVDLKELEKFGFKPRYDEITGKIVRYVRNDERNVIRYVDTHPSYNPYWEIDIDNNTLLYDLIKADLVEKVGS